MTWWDDLVAFADESPVLAGIVGTVVGGLILAAILWAISRVPRLRKPVFGRLGKIGRRLKSLRLTTTDRIEREYERGVDDGWAGHEHEVEEENAKPKKKAVSLVIGVDPATIAKEPPAPAPLPLPLPRWHAYWTNPDGDGFDWGLKNSVDRSIAREVRIEVDKDFFRLFDGAHWQDLSGPGAATFRGNLTTYGESRGVSFVFLDVSWFDEHGSKQREQVRMSVERPAWTRDDTPF